MRGAGRFDQRKRRGGLKGGAARREASKVESNEDLVTSDTTAAVR